MFDSAPRLAVIGLGYVGCPLAVSLGRSFDVTGFDLRESRVQELMRYHDSTGEVTIEEFEEANGLMITSNPQYLVEIDVFFITVPTPVDSSHNPDLSALQSACELVAKYLKKDGIVVFESTVYPGCTRNFCLPILSRGSSLSCGEGGFHLVYSPERINPGDRNHTLSSITKVISGSSERATSDIREIYGKALGIELFTASTIEVAEMAKVLENVQRDINIALMNEISRFCNAESICFKDVLDAARTKWNFCDFKPGLVGGHCIGVDPYYLLHKAGQIGFPAKLVQLGREVNESMIGFSVNAIRGFFGSKTSKNILILGAAFKSNCSDLRNSKHLELADELSKFYAVEVFDPLVTQAKFSEVSSLQLVSSVDKQCLDGVVLCLDHQDEEFQKMKADILGHEHIYLFDLTQTISRKRNVMQL